MRLLSKQMKERRGEEMSFFLNFIFGREESLEEWIPEDDDGRFDEVGWMDVCVYVDR